MTASELISSLDFESMLVGISKGQKLTPEEIEGIKNHTLHNLKSPRDKRSLEDLYASLIVLDKLADPNLSYIVAQFLDFQDPLIVSHALETLVIKWNNYDEILERIIQFSLGMSWDKDEDLKLTALNCLEHIIVNQKILNQDQKSKYTQLLLEVKKESKNNEEILEKIEQIKTLL